MSVGKAGKRKKAMPRWASAAAYVGVRTAVSCVLTQDPCQVLAAARKVGRAFGSARMNRKRLARAMEHLSIAYPDWDEAARRSYALRSYEHLFMMGVEMGLCPRLLSEDAWGDHVRIERVAGALEHLLRGTPVIMITGHCGNWEILGYTLSLLGFPVKALYRPLDLKPLDAWVRSTRERRGLVLVDKFGASESLPGEVAAGCPVGFVADQNAGDKGVFVPFFGRLASTYKTIGLLAIQSRAVVMCAQARRVETGSPWRTEVTGEDRAVGEGVVGFEWPPGAGVKYAMDVDDMILPEEWEKAADPLYYITARYRRAIERLVRRSPEQYLWMHRAWKSRPRHEREGKAFPAALKEKMRQLPWMSEQDVERVVDRSNRDAAELARGGAHR